MKRLGLTIAACSLSLITACTSSGSSGTANSSQTAANGSSSKGNGNLVIAETTPPPTFDPIASSLNSAEYAWQLSYEGLVRTNADGKIEPLLATSWTVSPDGKTYVFKIRQGVVFANGDPLTSADVVFSFNRLKESGVPFSKDRLAAIESVSASDDYTVTFTLSELDPGFLSVLGDPLLAGTAILDKKWASDHDPKTAMMGTGPFAFGSYMPNQELNMVRNDRYWDEANMAKVAKLSVKYMPQQSTQVAALKSGTIDLMFPTAESHTQLTSISSVSIDQVTSDATMVLNFNTAKAPFDNVDVRRAVSLAIDRDALVKGTYLGGGEVSAQIPPNYAWAPKVGDLLYQHTDRAQAKALLAQAGYSNGLDVTLNHYAGYTDYFDRFSQLVKSQLAEVGIRVTIQPNQQAVWLDKMNKGGAQFSDNEYGYGADPMLYLSPRPGRQGPPPSAVAAALANAAKAASPESYQTALVALEKANAEYVYPHLALGARAVWVATAKGVSNVHLEPTLSRSFLAAVSVS